MRPYESTTIKGAGKGDKVNLRCKQRARARYSRLSPSSFQQSWDLGLFCARACTAVAEIAAGGVQRARAQRHRRRVADLTCVQTPNT
eukprot:3438270-Amphidinium_carterae.1